MIISIFFLPLFKFLSREFTSGMTLKIPSFPEHILQSISVKRILGDLMPHFRYSRLGGECEEIEFPPTKNDQIIIIVTVIAA